MVTVAKRGEGQQCSDNVGAAQHSSLVERGVFQMVDAGDGVLHGQGYGGAAAVLVGVNPSRKTEAQGGIQESAHERAASHVGVPLEVGEACQAATADLE